MSSFSQRLCSVMSSLVIAAAGTFSALNVNAVSTGAKGVSLMEQWKNSSQTIDVSGAAYKSEEEANPISSTRFCADPTAVEYNGRLYVYGTSDHDEFEAVGANNDNNYNHIFGFEVFSTEDMVNWTYEGYIDVKAIAPWITNSWAPTICSRVESDGLTHFYLYFSNNGIGTAVITSTDPVKEWSDPLGHNLVDSSTTGLKNCPNPFDPGVCIDENGTGWLAFGGGNSTIHCKQSKIVQLGDDMISFASDFVDLDAPYLFEANELNYINGTYVYTYCCSWTNPETSEWDRTDFDVPRQCSMCYMTTKTPLDADSWEYQGEYLVNPGEAGQSLDYCNNHSHLHKYKDQWYILYHTLSLKQSKNYSGGFRSLCVDDINVDEENVSIELTKATRKGAEANGDMSPYEEIGGSTAFTTAEISASKDGSFTTENSGAWIYLRNLDFAYGAKSITANIKGSGVMQVRLDNISSEPVAEIAADSTSFTELSADFLAFSGRNHDVYLVFSDKDMTLASWSVSKGETTEREEDDPSAEPVETAEKVALTSLSYSLTAEGGDADLYVTLSPWAGKTINVKEGTADYDVAGAKGADGIINFGYVRSTAGEETDLESGSSVTINSLTINGHKFSYSKLSKIVANLTIKGGYPDGFSNIWSASITKAYSDDGAIYIDSEPDGKGGVAYFSVYEVSTAAPVTTTTLPVTTTTTSVTTTPMTTTTTSEPVPVTTADVSHKAGDANGDGDVSVADATLIMQAAANPDEYSIDPENAPYADVTGGDDGVTASDALAIQKFLAGVIELLPVS